MSDESRDSEQNNILVSPFHSLSNVRYPLKPNVDQRNKILIWCEWYLLPWMLGRLNTVQRELDTDMDKENIQNLIVNSKVQEVTKAFYFMLWWQFWTLGSEGEFQNRAKFHSSM